MDIQLEIYKLAEKLGITIVDRDPIESYLWNGKDIGIKNLDFSNQLHEIAHWLTSSSEMRLEKDFGLGPGPESGLDVKRIVSKNEVNVLEEEASILGIIYEAYFGLYFTDTLKDHSWHRYSKTYNNIIENLKRKDLIKINSMLERSKNYLFGVDLYKDIEYYLPINLP